MAVFCGRCVFPLVGCVSLLIGRFRLRVAASTRLNSTGQKWHWHIFRTFCFTRLFCIWWENQESELNTFIFWAFEASRRDFKVSAVLHDFLCDFLWCHCFFSHFCLNIQTNWSRSFSVFSFWYVEGKLRGETLQKALKKIVFCKKKEKRKNQPSGPKTEKPKTHVDFIEKLLVQVSLNV